MKRINNNFSWLRTRTVVCTTIFIVLFTGMATASDLVIQNQTISDTETHESDGSITYQQVTVNPDGDVRAVKEKDVILNKEMHIKKGAQFRTYRNDNDGMCNDCEITYFGNLDHLPDSDDDGDGLTNLMECQQGLTSPADPDSDDDGFPDNCEPPFDTTPPVITVTGPDRTSVCLNTSYKDMGATAFDNCLYDITGSIKTTNPVNTAIAGTYTVTYTVTDAGGLTDTAEREVRVVNPTLTATITTAYTYDTIGRITKITRTTTEK